MKRRVFVRIKPAECWPVHCGFGEYAEVKYSDLSPRRQRWTGKMVLVGAPEAVPQQAKKRGCDSDVAWRIIDPRFVAESGPNVLLCRHEIEAGD